MTTPDDLSDEGTALWDALTSYAVAGATIVFRPDELAILVQACRVADRLAVLEAELADDGKVLVPGSKGQLSLHPLIPEIRQQQALMATLLGRLNVPEATATAAWADLTPSQRARRAAHARWSS